MDTDWFVKEQLERLPVSSLYHSFCLMFATEKAPKHAPTLPQWFCPEEVLQLSASSEELRFLLWCHISFLSVLFCFYLGNSTVAVSDPLKKTKTEQTEKTTDVAPQKKCSSSELGHSHKNSGPHQHRMILMLTNVQMFDSVLKYRLEQKAGCMLFAAFSVKKKKNQHTSEVIEFLPCLHVGVYGHGVPDVFGLLFHVRWVLHPAANPALCVYWQN